jgi:hypothetical protein
VTPDEWDACTEPQGMLLFLRESGRASERKLRLFACACCRRVRLLLLPSGELDPARLAVLADALLDASCDDVQLLEHLRGEGPHWRGCFAVDAVLGKG